MSVHFEEHIMLNRCFLRLFLILAMVGITTPSLAAEDSSKAAKTRTLIDKVVAVVEGDVITLRALEALAAALSRRLTAIKMRKNEKHGARRFYSRRLIPYSAKK